MAPALEYRAGVEIRVAGRKLAGYAATFGTPAQIGSFRETIIAGAFRATLATRSDVVALVDHDATRLLARTASGTLRLVEDARGLQFELDLPQTQLGNDMLALAERRDLGGMSIGFRATDEAWPSRDVRELHTVELMEVSIAQAWPAYAGTEIMLRSREKAALPVDPHARRRLLDML
jgi:HK97 family phage prohead protease